MAPLDFGLYLCRHIPQHRVWMIRSYSITLVFFTSRALLPVPAYGNMGPTGIATSLFILQLSALMVPEIALNWSALTTRKKMKSFRADHESADRTIRRI